VFNNAVANFIGKFWGLFSVFIFVPLYIEILGFESYSFISFTLVISSIVAILDMGLSATLSRELARSDRNLEQKQNVFKTLESIYVIVFGCLVFVLVAFSGFIAEEWLNVETAQLSDRKTYVLIVSFEVGLLLVCRLYLGGLYGLEKHVSANVLQVGWGIVHNGLVVIAISIKPDLMVFFVWQLFSTILYVILLKNRLNKELLIAFSESIKFRIDKREISSVWKFSLGMMMISFIAFLNTQLDKISISKLLPLEELGYYTLAVSFSMVIVAVVSPIATTILPRVTFLFSDSRMDEAIALFDKINTVTIYFVFSLMWNIVFYSTDLVWMWTGNSAIALKVGVLLPVVVVSYSMLAITMLPYTIAIANGNTRLNNILGIVSLIVTVPGYWIVVGRYGAIGAAILYCAVQSTLAIVYYFYINRIYLTGNFSTLFLKKILTPFVCTMVLAYCFSLLVNLDSNHRVVVFLVVLCSFLFTLIFSILPVLSKHEVVGIRKYLSSMRN